MKESIPSTILAAIFKHIPQKKLFSVYAPVSVEWQKIAANVSPVCLEFKGVENMPSADSIERIIRATRWDIDSINVDLTFQFSIADINSLAGLRLNCLKIGNTGVSTLAPILESSKESMREIWLNNVPNMLDNDLIQVGEFSNLKKLVLSYNERLTDGILRRFPKSWDSLEYLDVSNTDITDVEPFSNYKNLRVLNLQLTEINSVASLRDLKKLQILDIKDTAVSDTSMINLANNNCADESAENGSKTRATGIFTYRSAADTTHAEPDDGVEPYSIGPAEQVLRRDMSQSQQHYHPNVRHHTPPNTNRHAPDFDPYSVGPPEQVLQRDMSPSQSQRQPSSQPNPYVYNPNAFTDDFDDDPYSRESADHTTTQGQTLQNAIPASSQQDRRRAARQTNLMYENETVAEYPDNQDYYTSTYASRPSAADAPDDYEL